MAAPDVVVNVAGLSFSYEGVSCLKDINFNLTRGSRCVLLGANGAGKSTLLRCVPRGSVFGRVGQELRPRCVFLTAVVCVIDQYRRR